MSDNKKNLLNESQIRQFMKLASLQPLTPGFVSGLNETTKGEKTERGTEAFRGMKKGEESEEHPGEEDDTAKKEKPGEDLRKGAEVRGAEGTKGKEGEGDAFVDVKSEAVEDLDESAGRGANEYNKPGHHRGGGEKGGGEKVRETMEYRDEDEELESELHATEDELGAEDHEADVEGDELDAMADDDVGAEAEASLTVRQVVDAIESALQDLLPNEEVEAEYVGDDVDVEAEEEFAPEGDEVVADIEVEDELEEALGFGKDYEKMAKGKKGSYAPDPEAGEKEWKGSAPGGSKRTRPRRRASEMGGGGGMTIKGLTSESQDELVEAITKRVAARILKAALSKK